MRHFGGLQILRFLFVKKGMPEKKEERKKPTVFLSLLLPLFVRNNSAAEIKPEFSAKQHRAKKVDNIFLLDYVLLRSVKKLGCAVYN